ncbi:hypothetical protein BKA64DRAFT_706512 [Cadophora sp. MPI-SDFR-AT-0126]|nr:hypothetical protein BKA64DRAFT_706512 [Leotiomycetes sp. MPI-SDFR-AT-0126]
MREAIQAHFKETTDVNELNTVLTQICQSVAHEVCRSYRVSQKSSAKTPQKQSHPSFTRQYKEAMQTSLDNGPILPTSDAIDATTEDFQLFSSRYATDSLLPMVPDILTTHVTILPDIWKAFFSGDKITAEIISQLGQKSCGSDGIYIRLLKSFINTEFIPLLEKLFLLCLQTGQTPKTRNQSEIHLLSKDPKKRPDANNLRPNTFFKSLMKKAGPESTPLRLVFVGAIRLSRMRRWSITSSLRAYEL